VLGLQTTMENWGNGTSTGTLTPTAATGLEKGVKAISASRYQTCALTIIGAVLCWGHNLNNVPTAIPGLPAHLTAIAAGTANTCAVTEEGTVWCWGAFARCTTGGFGLAQRCYRHPVRRTRRHALLPRRVRFCVGFRCAHRPKMVPGLDRDVTAISVGGEYACAVLSKGTVKCWGKQWPGEPWPFALSVKSSTTPVPVLGLKGVGELIC